MLHAHHILHSRNTWSVYPIGEKLRSTSELIPRINVETHNRLHRACPPIPLLGYHALLVVGREFEPVPGDTLATMDNLMLAMEAAARHPRAHEIERGLAELAVAAVEVQRPFIAEGLGIPDTTLFPLREVGA